jgi:hypothetical protein
MISCQGSFILGNEILILVKTGTDRFPELPSQVGMQHPLIRKEFL